MRQAVLHCLLPFLLLNAISGKAQTNTSLTPLDFENYTSGKDTVQVLDVRTASEYKSGHIKNALLADWQDQNEFARRIGFIDKTRPVYMYCLSGGRSAAAAKKMRGMGYSEVYELKGGINAWKFADRPVEGNLNEKQMSLDELNNAVNSSKTVLVDFGAEWCPPCKKMEPVLSNLQKSFAGKFTLVKVDGGRDEEILKNYKVTDLPVFILFKDGKQVWRKEGIVEEKEIADLIR
ncbi:MAG: thioredoxin domain-containing protein [Ferruginibacter sp.]